MSDSTSADLALKALLERWSRGDRDALDQLLTHLYTDLHAIAVRQLKQERRSSLRPTALVHEAYLRLSCLIDLDDLLTELEQYDSLAADIVSLRVFGGLSIEEVAASKEISVASVNRRWAAGKAWLTRELTRQ